MPVFAGTMDRLISGELVPFAAAVKAGAPLVMTAHILLPQIDAENPASLSRTMLDGVLRRQMRFMGVILADDLGMGAIAKRYGAGEAAVKTLQAGTDIAMLCHEWSTVAPAIAAVRNAQREGRFDENEWDASLARIERVCVQAEAPGLRPSIDSLGCKEHQHLANGISDRLRGILRPPS
jgi:beta-N-acetylhexosaminidase